MANRFFPNYDTYKITSRFGMRTLNGATRMHNGIDLVAKVGNGGVTDYITAHTGGTVTACGYDSSAGNLLKIQTAPGVIMVYYHLKNKPSFKVGDTVKTGEVIGYMGATGNVTGAHLHFGIQVNGNWVDPEPYLDCDYGGKVSVTAQPAVQTTTVQLPVLKRGMEGDTVKALQLLLIGYGYSCGDTADDGDFGPATENAVESFQEDNDLDADGCVGPLTWAALLGVGS